MATQMFKDGESIWLDPVFVPQYVDLGWTFSDPNAPLPQGVEVWNDDPIDLSQSTTFEVVLEEDMPVIEAPVEQPTKRRGRPPKK